MFEVLQFFCSCLSGWGQFMWAMLMFFVDMFIKYPILFVPLGITIVGNIIKSVTKRHLRRI